MFGHYSLISTTNCTVGSLQDTLSNRGGNPRCLQPTNSITKLRLLPVWPMKQKTVGGCRKTALFAKSHLFPLKIRVFKCMSVCVVRQKIQMVHYCVSIWIDMRLQSSRADWLGGSCHHCIQTRCQRVLIWVVSRWQLNWEFELFIRLSEGSLNKLSSPLRLIDILCHFMKLCWMKWSAFVFYSCSLDNYHAYVQMLTVHSNVALTEMGTSPEHRAFFLLFFLPLSETHLTNKRNECSHVVCSNAF